MKTNFYHSIISKRETMKRREEKEKWNDKKKKKEKRKEAKSIPSVQESIHRGKW